MSAIASDPLIAEAKTRARRRRLLGLGLALAATAAIATPLATRSSRSSLAVAANVCGITAVGTQIVQNGHAVYHLPLSGHWTHPENLPSQVECSGSTIWVMWFGGVATSKEGYFGARSADGGHTWRLILSGWLGTRTPHHLDAYPGPWTLRGPRDAYFVGRCPACSAGTLQGTVSLWVTKDAGENFREYKVPSLTGYEPTGLRVSRGTVSIAAKRLLRGLAPHRTATVRLR